MATNNKIIETIAAIKTLYPYYAKDTNKKILVQMWTALLKPYNDEIVDKALYKCLQICKMPPTPADLIEQINQMNKAEQISEYELWDIYCNALRQAEYQAHRLPYTFVDATGISQGDQARQRIDEIWNGLPEELKMYVASKNEFVRIARSDFQNDLKFEKQRFIKAIPTITQRIEDKKLLLNLTQDSRLLHLVSGEE